MKILVLNSGSSSLKYQLFDMTRHIALAKGIVEKIGLSDSSMTYDIYLDNNTPNNQDSELKSQDTASKYIEKTINLDIHNHVQAIDFVIQMLTHAEHGILSDIHEIKAVGHRIVHGGSLFHESVELTNEIIGKLEEINDLAPLHNPPAIAGIRACQEVLPGVPNIGVFDTSFHQTMPPSSYVYPIAYEMYEKYKIRRYGFHGTSHRYISQKALELLAKPADSTKIVTCHLGNGSSFAALVGGKVVDTSMGFTPLEGMMMGTRCGDLDPSIVLYLLEKGYMNLEEISDFLNKKSGMLGVSGVSSDLRDIHKAIKAGNERAILTMEMVTKKIIKYIGAYAAEMNGVDAIVFSAGIGENDIGLREEVCNNLSFLGVKIDSNLNDCRGVLREISTPESKVKVFIIPTNEELLIAQDTEKIVTSK